MNFFYHHSTYVRVQKIQDLCQNFIIMFIICSLRHFDEMIYYHFYWCIKKRFLRIKKIKVNKHLKYILI